ncbi:unnamed protein product [Lepidochelys kempii]
MTLPCTRSSWGPTGCRPVSRIAPTPHPCNAVFRASGNTAAAPDPRQPHPQRAARLPPRTPGSDSPQAPGAGAPAGGTFAKEVSVPTVDTPTCEALSLLGFSSPARTQQTQDDMLWAGYPEGQRDTCPVTPPVAAPCNCSLLLLPRLPL